jgi:hypothetical protein
MLGVLVQGIHVYNPPHIDREFCFNVSEFFFTLLFELLRFIGKKLEAFDAIGSGCYMLIIN